MQITTFGDVDARSRTQLETCLAAAEEREGCELVGVLCADHHPGYRPMELYGLGVGTTISVNLGLEMKSINHRLLRLVLCWIGLVFLAIHLILLL